MTILLLAGAGEARRVAAELARAGVPAEASLLRPMRAGPPLDLPVRIGPFGGDSAFRAYLDARGIERVIDATHPFAAHVSARTAAICAQTARGYLRLVRPAWVATAEDHWISVDREEDAAHHIPQGARVFVGTGRGTEGAFESLAGREKLFRILGNGRGRPGLPSSRYLPAKPPFTVAQEKDLFRAERIDWLVVRNVGGSGAWPKIQAARELGLPVVMVQRPVLPGPQVGTVDAVMEWVRR